MEISECTLPSGFCLFIDINRSFDFLRNEGYTGSRFYIGRDVSVAYSNHKNNQTISIVIPEPCSKWKCEVTIQKHFFVFSKMISVTNCLEFGHDLSVLNQLTAYAKFIRENSMSIIRGEKWTHISKCQYQKSTESVVRCVDLEDLSERELLFWELYSTFDFLYIEGYHCKKFNIGNIVSLTLNNHLLKQNVIISVNSLSREWDVTIEKERFTHSRIISVKELLDSHVEYRDICLLNTYIRQNLMPVIRGEMWIDELLIKLGKTPPVIEKTKARYVKSE